VEDREAAASQIAENYLHFVQVYEGQAVAWRGNGVRR